MVTRAALLFGLLVGCGGLEASATVSGSTEAPVVVAETPAPATPASPDATGEVSGTGASGESSGPDAELVKSPDPAPSACSGTVTGFFANRTIAVGGVTRRYDLFVPEAAKTEALPVVFVFHGDGGGTLRPWFPIEQVSEGRAIVVYPYGFSAWNLEKEAGNADYAFIEALRASIAGGYCVDRDRFFAFGLSNGAFFVNMLGCYRGPTLFRGIATNAGGLYPPDGAAGHYDSTGAFVCPNPPVASLVMHGKQDTVVSYTIDGLGARDSWRRANQCQTTSKPFGPSPCVAYDGCALHPVVFCGFTGGHVLWSEAASASWQFFQTL